ncbi:DUF6182 family protein [Streptomyces luteocolor]|uniref:DUF6182 family protein n=1 Tax=Streptomyces luteocolor TaxID=285500 RepID=UPI00085333E0|nr:DUF6182 family protein [Streptomyces luteocolor]
MTPAMAATRTHDRLSALFDERARLVAEATTDTTPVTALVLLRALDVVDVVQGARAFAAGLTEAEGRTWLRSWTRTRFLFGNPANLPERTPARAVAPGGTAAWLGTCPKDHLPGVGRLLKPLTGALPRLPDTLDVPGSGAGPVRELLVATRDVTLVQYLVHLHHTIAEATLLGRLGTTEPLRLTHLPDLDADRAHGDPGYARVHYAAENTPELRLYTSLAP